VSENGERHKTQAYALLNPVHAERGRKVRETQSERKRGSSVQSRRQVQEILERGRKKVRSQRENLGKESPE